MSRSIVIALALGAAILRAALPTAAEDAASAAQTKIPAPVRRDSWPIYNWLNHQPTQKQLDAMHAQDVTPDQAREVEWLYDQLMRSSKKMLARHPGSP